MDRLEAYEEELVYKLIDNKDSLDTFLEGLFSEVEKDPIEDDKLRKAIGKLKRLEFINGIWADDIFMSAILLSKISSYVSLYPRLVELNNEQVRNILAEARDKYGIDNILPYFISSCGHHQMGWEQVDEFEWRIKVETSDFVTLNKTSRFIIEQFDKYGYKKTSESLDDSKPRKKKYLQFKHKSLCNKQDESIDTSDTFMILFRTLLGACKSAQSFEEIRHLDENGINTYIRDLLKQHQYKVSDQTLKGVSPSRKGPGELDIFIETLNGNPITVIEALKLDCINKSNIDLHINKIFGYDANGLKDNIILIYSYAPNFLDFFNKYIEYIRNTDFDMKFLHVRELKADTVSEIRVVTSTYMRSGLYRNLYHIIINFN